MLEVQSHLNCFVYIVPSSGSCRVSSELTAYIKLLVSDDFAIVLLCSCVICFLEKKLGAMCISFLLRKLGKVNTPIGLYLSTSCYNHRKFKDIHFFVVSHDITTS
jgi:hypothetical protein